MTQRGAHAMDGGKLRRWGGQSGCSSLLGEEQAWHHAICRTTQVEDCMVSANAVREQTATGLRGVRGGRALAQHGLEVLPLAGGGCRPEAHVPVLEQRQARAVAGALAQHLPPPLLHAQRRLQRPVIRLELHFRTAKSSIALPSLQHARYAAQGDDRADGFQRATPK